MARGKGRGPQQPMKGFRPGKEPPELRKRRAKSQFGELSSSQERLVEVFAERSPEEARRLIRRWTTGALVAGVLLAVVAILLTAWSVVAAIVLGVLAAGVLFLWWRLRGQREGLETMADAVIGGTKSKGTRKRK